MTPRDEHGDNRADAPDTGITAAAARTIDEISDDYVERFAALHPVEATIDGVGGHDAELTDYSPEGALRRADLARVFLGELGAVQPSSDRDRRAVRVLRERLDVALALFDAGEHLRDVSNLSNPLNMVRMCFDLMPAGDDKDWSVVADRMEKVPASLGTYRQALAAGIAAGMPGSQRLALVAAGQAQDWAGTDGAPGYFTALAARADDVAPELSARLTTAAQAASAALVEISRYLREEYAPRASDVIGVGADRYALHARYWTGDEVDLDETYTWGWAELARLLGRMEQVAEQILPGRSLRDVVEHVKADPAYVLDSAEALREWLQTLMDTTVEQLDGVHFDIPPQIRRVEAVIAPPGGAAAMYYTPPSEDFTRPGRTWYPTQGRTSFPLWLEKAICYHEGVPGHHLEVGGAKARPSEMTRFQRLSFTSGYSEGWALYAERLMSELGYLDDPVFELGALATSAMRAARVVIDIGLHLGLRIPDHPGWHAPWLQPGAPMTPENALEIAVNVAPFPREFMASEIDRYIGMPAQAISYKVGERVWLSARDEAKARHGAAFDLKEFHSYALGLGSVGLAQLRDELAAF